MKAKPTSGPWTTLDTEPGKNYIRVRGTQIGRRYRIANVLFAADTPEEVAEASANAQLIAQAPRMRQLLELIHDELESESSIASWSRAAQELEKFIADT